MWTSIDSKMLASFSETVGAGIAVFDVKDAHDIQLLSTNSALRAMYGLTTKEHGAMLRNDLMDVFGNTSRECARQLMPMDFDHALNGNTVWLRVRMIPFVPKQEGGIVRIFVSVVDITANRRLEQNLQVANTRLYDVVDSSLEGIVTVDTDQRIKSLSKAAHDIFGYTDEEIIGQPLALLIPERFRAKHTKYVLDFQGSRDTTIPSESRMEIWGRRKDGSEFLAEIAISKINVGGILEFRASIRDVSEHLRLIDELYIRASIDPLTCLHNHHHMLEEAEKELVRAKRFSHPVSVIWIDLDDFKSINDTYGHLIGDQVLMQIARICKQEVRLTDIVARWGGEAFLLLLPETDVDGAVCLARRILNQLHGLHLGISQLGKRRITASIGISGWRGDSDNFDAMVHRAGHAMHNAKTSGKDKIIRVGSPPCHPVQQGPKSAHILR